MGGKEVQLVRSLLVVTRKIQCVCAVHAPQFCKILLTKLQIENL